MSALSELANRLRQSALPLDAEPAPAAPEPIYAGDNAPLTESEARLQGLTTVRPAPVKVDDFAPEEPVELAPLVVGDERIDLAAYAPEPAPVGLRARAVLVDLTTRKWTGQVKDADASEQQAATAGANKDKAGKYIKNLIDPEAMAEINLWDRRIDEYHRKTTMPWKDGGIRLLPAAMLPEYRAKMRDLVAQRDHAVVIFLSQYQTRREDAVAMLGTMFRDTDYPTTDQLRRKFSVEFPAYPVPAGGHFVVDLGNEEVERLRQGIEDMANEALLNIRRELASRAEKRIRHLAEKLRAYTPPAPGSKASGVFRDGTVEAVRTIAAELPVYNVGDDPDVSALVADIERDLTAHDAETLRADPTAREKTAQAAEDILRRMASVF